jgi:hypothetical protein
MMSDTLYVFLEASGSQRVDTALKTAMNVVNCIKKYCQENYIMNNVKFYRYNSMELEEITPIVRHADIKDTNSMLNILKPINWSSIENVVERVEYRELENVILLTDGILQDMSCQELEEATKNMTVLWDGNDSKKYSISGPHIYRVDKNTEENVEKALQAVLNKQEKDDTMNVDRKRIDNLFSEIGSDNDIIEKEKETIRVYMDGSNSVQEEDLRLWQKFIKELKQIYDVTLILPKRSIFVEIDVDSFIATPNPSGFIGMFGGYEFDSYKILKHEKASSYENDNVVLLTDYLNTYLDKHHYDENKDMVNSWTVVINMSHYKEMDNKDYVMWLNSHNVSSIVRRLFEHRWENRMDKKLNELKELFDEVDDKRLEEYMEAKEIKEIPNVMEIVIDYSQEDKYGKHWTLEREDRFRNLTYNDGSLFATIASAMEQMGYCDKNGMIGKIVFTKSALQEIKKIAKVYTDCKWITHNIYREHLNASNEELLDALHGIAYYIEHE